MISQWLNLINYVIGAIIVCLLIWTAFFWLGRPNEIVQGDLKPNQSRLPKIAFELPAEAYHDIDSSLLALQCSSPTLQVPDLRTQLIYYGKNGRPDAQAVNTSFHFSINGSKTVVSATPGERLYLVYEKKGGPCRYIFSPENEKTSLWIVAAPTNTNEVSVTVSMEDEKGNLIEEPKSNIEFKLTEKEFIRYAGVAWELGTWRVDGTLLARMRARWHGPDRFLEKHGGSEYAEIASKQRIDFGEGDEIYSVFVAVGDCLIWDPEKLQWQVVQPSEKSLKYPLLVVKKMEDRLMGFELWDVDGKGKVSLNILKSTEPLMTAGAQNILNQFKFVGARTKSQCVFEINRERMVLRPSDWLLLTPKGWKKLTTEQEIDDYVNRRTSGNLFVFEGLSRKDEKQVMMGMLYNASRSDSQEIELPLTTTIATQGKKPGEAKEKEKEKDKEKDRNGVEALKERLHNNIRADGEIPSIPQGMPPHLPKH
jgi:hypothetical protein